MSSTKILQGFVRLVFNHIIQRRKLREIRSSKITVPTNDGSKVTPAEAGIYPNQTPDI